MVDASTRLVRFFRWVWGWRKRHEAFLNELERDLNEC